MFKDNLTNSLRGKESRRETRVHEWETREHVDATETELELKLNFLGNSVLILWFSSVIMKLPLLNGVSFKQ